MGLFEFILSLNILDIITDTVFYIQYNYPNLFINFDNLFTLLYQNIFYLSLNLYTSLTIVFTMKYLNSAIFNMGFKFILLIALLVFVRGGIPRYRFDFLTKIGWIKFLSLILSIFLSSILFIFLF